MKIKLSSIMVEDQATALAFYTDVLGFKKSKDIPVGNSGGSRLLRRMVTRMWSWCLNLMPTLPGKFFKKRCLSKESLSPRLRWTTSKQRRID